MPQQFPKKGDLFERRYRIDSIIGVGGFAKVYGATQTELGRAVAIKVLSRGVDADSPEAEARAERASRRFRREARLVSQLRDANTVTVFDYGETDAGLLYIVFERVDGRSLKEVLLADGPMEAAAVAEVLRCVLSSLEEAHAFGVLHRDIKPANIMVHDQMGELGVKLLDFGIAKSASPDTALAGGSGELTREGALVGTPRYMSPEQIRGQQMTPASDLFSLGLVAYEMLTAKQANPGDTPITVIGRQLDDRPFVLPWREDLPIGLRRVVHRLMEKDVERRFQTASEAAEALESWDDEGEDETLDITLIEVERRDSAESVTQPDATDDEVAPPSRRPWGALALVAVALLVAGIALVSTGERPAEIPQEKSASPAPVVVAVEAEPPVEESGDVEPDGERSEKAIHEKPANRPPEPTPEKAASPRPERPPTPRVKADSRGDRNSSGEPKRNGSSASSQKPEREAASETSGSDEKTDDKSGFFSLDDAL